MTDEQRATGVSSDSAVTIFPGPQAAFFSTFHSPATVDHRVVRVNGVITFLIAVSTAVFADHPVTEWVVSVFVREIQEVFPRRI